MRWAIDQLKFYLWGQEFTVVNVHAPLLWLAHMKDTNPCLMQWYLTLQQYCFTLKYHKEMEYANTDLFSHQTVSASLDWEAALSGCLCEPRAPPPNLHLLPHPGRSHPENSGGDPGASPPPCRQQLTRASTRGGHPKEVPSLSSIAVMPPCSKS